MSSELLKSIKSLKVAREKEIDLVRKLYSGKLTELLKQCKHIDDEGFNMLVPAGHPFHSGWDMCQICGKYIETNEFGRD